MNEVSRGEMGFEDWLELARSNPEAFEARRKQAVEHAISQAPEDVQQRLRSLQWRIDRTREQARTPMSSVMAISNMMWDNYRYLNGFLHQLAQPSKPVQPTRNATVLPFRKLQSVPEPSGC